MGLWNKCGECGYMDMSDSCRYDRSQRYCSYFRKYYNPGDTACRHFAKGYVTTVISEILGLDDYYMNIFNKTRISLENDPKYSELFKRYDEVGPYVAEALMKDGEKEVIASKLLEKVIVPCSNFVENGDMDNAVSAYCSMMRCLQDLYNINVKNSRNIKLQSWVRKRAVK